jgi:hypothetical protein
MLRHLHLASVLRFTITILKEEINFMSNPMHHEENAGLFNLLLPVRP